MAGVDVSTLLIQVDTTQVAAANSALAGLAKAANATGMESTRLGNQFSAASKAMSDQAAKMQAAFSAGVKPINEQVKRLSEQYEEMKKSGAATEELKAKQDALKAAQAEAAVMQDKYAASMDNLVKTFEDGKALMEQYQTPMEKYNQKLAELDEMHKRGAIDAKTHAAALADLNKSATEGIAAIAKYSAAGVAAFAAVGTAVAALAIKTGQYADKLLDLGQITGLSTDAIQEFEHVARAAGVSSEGFLNTIQRLNGQMPEIATGTGNTAIALDKLGISIKDASGNTRDMNDLFPEILNQLQQMESIVDRNAIAHDIFGRSLTDVAPILGLSAAEMAKLRKEAHETGRVMSGDSLKSANNFRIAVEDLKSQMVSMGHGIATDVIPVLKDTLIPFVQSTAVPALKLAADTVGRLVKVFGAFPAPVQAAIVGIGGLAAAAPPAALGLIAIANAKTKIIAEIPKLIAGLNMTRTAFLTAFPVAAIAAAGVALGVLILKTQELNAETKKYNEETDRLSGITTQLSSDVKAAKAAVAEYEKLHGRTGEAAKGYEELRRKQEDATIALKQHALAMAGKAAMDEMEIENTRRRIRGEAELLPVKQKTEKQLADEAGALKKANEKAQEHWQKLRDDGKAAYEAVMTPMEKYGAELERLDRLKKAGVITQETYNRATASATDALDAARENLLSSLDTETEAIARAHRKRTEEIERAYKDQIIIKEEADKLMVAAGEEERKALDELDKKRKVYTNTMLTDSQRLTEVYKQQRKEMIAEAEKWGFTEADIQKNLSKLQLEYLNAQDAAYTAEVANKNKLLGIEQTATQKITAEYNARLMALENSLMAGEITNQQFKQAELGFLAQYNAQKRELAQKEFDESMAFMQAGYDKEAAMLYNYYDTQMAIIQEKEISGAISFEKAQERRVLLTQKANDAMLKIELQRMSTIAGATTSFLGGMTDLTAAAFGEQFALTKAFGIASATVNTIAAVASALATQPFIPAGLVAWGTALSATAGLVGQIKNATFSGAYDAGGMIPRGQYGIVGELGPEIVRGPAAVTSRADTADILAGGRTNTAPTTENNNITVNFTDDRGNIKDQMRDAVHSGELIPVLREALQTMGVV